jgi:hypothetical protein
MMQKYKKKQLKQQQIVINFILLQHLVNHALKELRNR